MHLKRHWRQNYFNITQSLRINNFHIKPKNARFSISFQIQILKGAEKDAIIVSVAQNLVKQLRIKEMLMNQSLQLRILNSSTLTTMMMKYTTFRAFQWIKTLSSFGILERYGSLDLMIKFYQKLEYILMNDSWTHTSFR